MIAPPIVVPLTYKYYSPSQPIRDTRGELYIKTTFLLRQLYTARVLNSQFAEFSKVNEFVCKLINE